jgi:hypothetical protein
MIAKKVTAEDLFDVLRGIALAPPSELKKIKGIKPNKRLDVDKLLRELREDRSRLMIVRPFGQPKSLQLWGKWTAAYSSELIGIECRRAIDRLRLESLYNDQQVAQAMEQLKAIERTIKRIQMTRSILQGAAKAMPTVVKTLDAIHLSSAIAIRERRGIELLFATHDTQQATAARALGFTRTTANCFVHCLKPIAATTGWSDVRLSKLNGRSCGRL